MTPAEQVRELRRKFAAELIPDNKHHDEIIRLRAQNLTIQDIRYRLRMNEGKVRRHLREAGK